MLQTFKANLDDIRQKITRIGEDLVKSNELILLALENCDEVKFNEARNYIKNITSKTDEIDNAVIKVLALYTPEARDLRQVVAYFKITNELSRACSNTRSFIRDLLMYVKILMSKRSMNTQYLCKLQQLKLYAQL